MNLDWIAAFSQTGGEICNLMERGYVPDMIVTNNMYGPWDPRLGNYKVPLLVSKHDQLWETVYKFNPRVVTLHGYLRIIPEYFCRVMTIINGHPGDVIIYPELAGKDPQQKAIDLKLPASGVVIHRVTETVDDGEVLAYNTLPIDKGITTEQLISQLKSLQEEMWVEVLDGVL